MGLVNRAIEFTHCIYVHTDKLVAFEWIAGVVLMQVLDLTGVAAPSADSSLSPVQISTTCVAHDIVAVGGFNGELVVKSLAIERPVSRSKRFAPLTMTRPT